MIPVVQDLADIRDSYKWAAEAFDGILGDIIDAYTDKELQRGNGDSRVENAALEGVRLSSLVRFSMIMEEMKPVITEENRATVAAALKATEIVAENFPNTEFLDKKLAAASWPA